MKNKKNLIVIFIALIMIVSTIAFFANDSRINNDFDTGSFGTTFIETFSSPNDWVPGTTTPTNFVVKNSSQTPIVIRMSYTEKWVDDDDNEIDNVKDGISAGVVNFANQSDWINEGNYYYYKHKLLYNQEASNPIESVTYNSDVNGDYVCVSQNLIYDVCTSGIGEYNGATYYLDVKFETIQYRGYQNAWNTQVEID